MVTSEFYPDNNFRPLLTVPSTSNTAFAASDSDIANIVAAGGSTAQQLVNARCTDLTVAASRGRIIDLGVFRGTPLQRIAGGQPSTALQLAPPVSEVGGSGTLIPKRLIIIPAGVGAEDTTYLMQVFQCFRRGLTEIDDSNLVFTFEPMISLTITLGVFATNSGVSNEVFAKTIAVVSGSDNISYQLMNSGAGAAGAWEDYPANAAIALATQGSRYIYIRVTRNTSATSMNPIWGAC